MKETKLLPPKLGEKLIEVEKTETGSVSLNLLFFLFKKIVKNSIKKLLEKI